MARLSGMRVARLPAAFFSLVFVAAGQAAADPPATPAPKPESAPQHVTAPSLPGQPNKQGTVTPEGGMPMDSEGYAVTKRYDPGATPAKAGAPAGSKAAGAPQAAAGAPAGAATGPGVVPSVPIGPAPTGKAVATGANLINIRGSLVSIDPGKTVTIKLLKTGTENTYTLVAGAKVAADLKPGQQVRVRVLAAEKGKVADRVELVPAPTAVPAAQGGKP